ncbi:hypothetical protein AYO44_08365 [Planctomycetaceae bacterium SCGC AG-212-F19]|nr:hypothetical protein AYO44_08365 [Planctomycetaceae bacterium SCGC AG-212-F19]
MVWIALGLLVLTATIVLLNTARDRWTMGHYRWVWTNPEYRQWEQKVARKEIPHLPPGVVPTIVQNQREAAQNVAAITDAIPWEGCGGLPLALGAAYGAVLDNSGLAVFSRWLVYSVFVGFLLPVWSLSFATEALGGEREARSLIWLLSRPLSRPAIYAAKFVALLPWILGFNVGGFAVLCLAAGAPGRQAFVLYWPAVVAASLAFGALFHLMSAVFRRPAIMAICYTFFLEIILGTMPGYMKRISIGFYTRCLMFDAAENLGVQAPEKPSMYLPVDSVTAFTVLLATTAVLLIVGMFVFARSEYWEDL